MIRKDRANRRHQRLRVIAKRVRDYSTCDPGPTGWAWAHGGAVFGKRRPMGSCGNMHCFTCRHQTDAKRMRKYRKEWRQWARLISTVTQEGAK